MPLLDMLLNHHKTVDHPSTMPGDESLEAKVFYTNVNRRDAKGWSPVAVAVFHDRKKAAAFLLENGADPSLANQFGHTAYDIAKDTIAGDEKTVLKDKSEVRAVLNAHDEAHRSTLFGDAAGIRIADGTSKEALPDGGTGVAMQVEAAADAALAPDPKKKPTKGGKKAGLKAAARLSAKKGGKKKRA